MSVSIKQKDTPPPQKKERRKEILEKKEKEIIQYIMCTCYSNLKIK